MSDLIDCPNCGIGLDLDASIHYGELGYCPKCGESFEGDTSDTDDWQCELCGDQSEFSQEICYNCFQELYG